MRVTVPFCVLLAASGVLGPGLVSSASAQPQPQPKVIRVDFMKIVEGKASEYAKLEEMWKTVHQDRVKKGQIESWSVYSVLFPGASTSREYDAVTMTVFSTFAKMERSYDEDQIAKIRSFPLAQEIRKIVRDEIWYLHLTAGTDFLASKYATVLFHKAKLGQLGDYLRAQKENYVSINEDLIKSGVRKAWHSLGVMYPSSSRREYDWVTFDCFDRFDAPVVNTVAGIDPQRLSAANKAVSAHREVVLNEYWQLVNRTAPK